MQEFFLKNFMNEMIAGLYVVATPIGNFGDITLRAIEVLKNCDFVVCEDSRVTLKLLNKLEIKKPFIIYNDQSDDLVRGKILSLIKEGKIIALVSDAGTPLISDPGYKLVNMLIRNGIKVIAIPGPSSVIAALSISGIESNRFLFAGFIPDSKIAQEKLFKELAIINSSLIFFEAANQVLPSLEMMLEIFGNRSAAVVREITKIYEETKKDSLSNLVKYYQENNIKGEVVILVSPPKSDDKEIDLEALDLELKSGLKKFKPKDLVGIIADNYGLNKKIVYQRMLELKDEK